MNIYTAKEMSLDQIRSEYRKYLQRKGLSKNTINTSVNDAFYLWKNAFVLEYLLLYFEGETGCKALHLKQEKRLDSSRE